MSPFQTNQMNLQDKLISIICVAFGGLKITEDCLKSLNQITYSNVEIILVDNSPFYSELQSIISNFKNVKFLRLETNTGYAAACNVGFEHANGEYILFINNDITVEKDFLEPLVFKLKNHPEVGGASPKIMYMDKKNIIQYAGFTPYSKYTLRNKRIGDNEIDEGQYDDDKETYSLHGAAMIIKREVIQKLGKFNEFYFLCGEEIDYSRLIAKIDYSMYYVHNSKIYHKGSASVKKAGIPRIRFEARSRLLFMQRFYSGCHYCRILFYLMWIARPKNLFCHLLKGNDKYTAYRDGFKRGLEDINLKAKFNLPV